MRLHRQRWPLVLAAILFAFQPALPAPAAAGSARAAASQPTAGDGLVTYHYDLARSGFDPAEPGFSGLTGHWAATVDADVYAEPLVYNGRVYIGTTNDSVYAFDAAGGAPLWHVSVGTPHPGTYCASSIQPGIESTPAIDPATGTLYVVAVTGGATPVYQLFQLSSATGAQLAAPITISGGATNVDVPHYQQRSALAVNGGYVYVAYAGWVGDCAPYRGTVEAVNLSTNAITEWQVPGGRGGIWGPGGPAVDAAGNVYVATGNDDSPCTTYGWGDSVVELNPTASALVDWFAPHDWCNLAATDTDLGGINPTILGSSGLVFIGGKNGVGYLLRQGALGHVSLSSATDGAFHATVCGGEILSGTAYAPPYLYVSCGGATYALNVNTSTPSFSVAWSRSAGCALWSPLVAGGVVWVLDNCGGLHGFAAAAGSDVFSSVGVGSGGPHFVTPAVFGRRVFTASGTSVQSYAFAPLVAGSYHALAPKRVYDTRAGAKLGPGSSVDVPVVALSGGLITGTPSAVTLGLGVTNPTGSSFLVVYPTGSPRPNASNVNFTAWQTIAALVQVPLGTGGSVTVYNSQGSTDFFLDLNGFYDSGPAPGSTAGRYVPLPAPTRVLDTRTMGSRLPLGPGGTLNFAVSGGATGVPAGQISAVVLNVTSVDATEPSYLAVYPEGGPVPPTTSNVNFPAHTVIPDRAIVQTAVDPTSHLDTVTVYNSVGSVHVVVDLAGYFTNASGSGGSLYHPLAPVRLLDTRRLYQTGQYASPWPPNASRPLNVAGLAGVDPAAVAFDANVTVTNSDAGSYLTVYPAPAAPPGSVPPTSDLNFGYQWVIANQVLAKLGGGQVAIYNNQGGVDVIVDVEGWYG